MESEREHQVYHFNFTHSHTQTYKLSRHTQHNQMFNSFLYSDLYKNELYLLLIPGGYPIGFRTRNI